MTTNMNRSVPKSRPTWLDPVIGATVAKLRKYKKVTQDEASAAMHISKSLLSMLESGRKPWNTTTMAAACAYFDIPPSALFSDTSVVHTKIIAAYERLSPVEKGLVLRTLGHKDLEK